jgi:hypothetical protein
LGVIAWTKVFQPLMEARAKMGMKPEDRGPLTDNNVRAELAATNGPLVEEGIKNLEGRGQGKPKVAIPRRLETLLQALALLPLDQGEETERQWLQNTLTWLKSAPPETRTQRLRYLAEGMRKLPDAGQRFQLIWAKACPPRLYSEAGFAEATSLPRELIARLKRRILPQLEDELDLYAALHMAGSGRRGRRVIRMFPGPPYSGHYRITECTW